jgi:hypothetical protein
MSTVLLSLVLAAALGQVEADTEAADRKERHAHMKERAAELSLHRGPGAKEKLPLSAEPVIRYSNAERDIGSLDGLTFLWLADQRPVAAVSLSLRRVGFQVYHECTSFVAEPLECRRDAAVLWAPKTGSPPTRQLAKAPPPAAGKTQRLNQMRTLARQFTATCFHPKTDVPTELRLLPAPLYRWSDEATGIVDGGLFTFVVSNDPELFLLLEATGEKDGAEGAWRYSLARMSSLKMAVQHGGKEVWTTTNYWQDPQEDRKTGPYVEARIGTFETRLAPEE